MKGITRKRINAKKGGPGGSGGSGTITNINTTGPITGGPITVSGTIGFDQGAAFTWTGSHTFTSLLPTSAIVPVNAIDFVNKAYVDALAAGIIPAGTVLAATTAALPACTYANGAAGVGATLTASAPGAFPNQDGVAFTTSDSLLVKDQAVSFQNGQYILTDAGSGITPWILTRRTSYDTAAEIRQGTATPVLAGTLNGGKVFWMVSPDPTTIGTDPITFDILFIGGTTYLQGNGIDLSGNTISVSLWPTGALYFNTGTLAVGVDVGTINVNGLNQLTFVGNSTDVANTSLVAGATVTDALNTLAGTLNPTFNEVLTNGNTTSLTAIFDNGAGTVTEYSPGLIDSNASLLINTDLFRVLDSTSSYPMLYVDAIQGIATLGDSTAWTANLYLGVDNTIQSAFVITPNCGIQLNSILQELQLSSSDIIGLHGQRVLISDPTLIGGYEIPVLDGNNGETLVTDGAGVVSWGAPNGYTTIVPISAAALLTLALGGAMNPKVVYQILDAGQGTAGVTATLNIIAQDDSTLQSKGNGIFLNVNTPAQVQCVMGYDLINNFIISVEEPIYNNKVYAGIRTSSATIEQSVIHFFPFNSSNIRDNTFNGCQWDNYDNTGQEIRGCNQTCTWIAWNNHKNCEMINQFMEGVSNQLSGSPDINITSDGTVLECNDFWGNDSEGTLTNVGASAEVSYIRIGWFSNLDMDNQIGGDFRFNNIGSTAHIKVSTTSGVRYCEFGNGVNVTLDGLTLQCNFLSGDQGGIEVLNFHGTKSTLINCDYSSGVDELTCDGSILNTCTISSNIGAPGTNVISNSNLTNCTIDFAGFDGCSITGLTAENQTITFTGNNQVIGPVNMVHAYADATARNAAITLPLPGMICVLDSTRNLSFYTASAGWINL